MRVSGVVLLKSVNSNTLKKFHCKKYCIRAFILYAYIHKKHLKGVWSKLLPEDSKAHTFCSKCNYDSYHKSSEKQDKKIVVFLQRFQPHSLVEQVMKVCCRLCLFWNRCQLGPYATAASDFFIIIVVDFFKCDWACLLQRSLRNICVHGRHGYCLVVIIPRPEITKVEEELQVSLEIFVQESIKYGVDTSRYHCREVAEQE